MPENIENHLDPQQIFCLLVQSAEIWLKVAHQVKIKLRFELDSKIKPGGRVAKKSFLSCPVKADSASPSPLLTHL
jgi:hypothetical protein